MANRALAHIEEIAWVKPIEGADNIELVGVLGWQCVAKKNEFKPGDICVYIEIDSKVPQTSEFEFLSGKHYKIKTMKFNKFKDENGNPIISQGIALSDMMFDSLYDKIKLSHKFHIGDDVTDVLGVTYSSPEDVKRKSNVNPDSKYQSMIARRKEIFSRPWIKKMMKHKWFRAVMFAIFGKKKDKPLQFPSWIQKTDEERIENLPNYLNDKTTVWLMTEKIDGTSTTFALDERRFRKPEFIVCSRNVRMQKPDQPCFFDENVYWKIAKKYNVEENLKKITKKIEERERIKINRIVLQGETFGAKLQGNPYKMNDIDFRAFNLVVTGTNFLGKELNFKYITSDMEEYLEGTGIKCVPILGEYMFPENITMQEFKAFADGNSVINENVMREGIVFRNVENARQSFKNVSNTYLLKHSS